MPETFSILYEDNHLLVVNKPALLATMGVSTGETSLVTLVKDYLKKKYDKPGNVYLGVVSRLDAFVSGVTVLARTSKAAARLNDQFRQALVEKTYWAIVPDNLPSERGRLKDRLVKDDARRRMITVGKQDARYEEGKEARLTYQVIGRCRDQCLVQIHLETGRKHQIRVQLEAIGCPIVGDRKYNSPLHFDPGIALHSRQLKITHPTLKKEMAFESPPGDSWQLDRFGELSN
ncbi:MAG: RluA family pseudouridine synthase [Mariniblastus sp.]|nr:RluA family pseudouridine synthase [Mariniblastus sp.]